MTNMQRPVVQRENSVLPSEGRLIRKKLLNMYMYIYIYIYTYMYIYICIYIYIYIKHKRRKRFSETQ